MVSDSTAPMPSSIGSTPSAMRSEAPASPSYINLEKTKERGIRVCNVLHYGDHAVAEHAMALLMELTRHAERLICRSSKAIGTVPTVSTVRQEARHHRTRRHRQTVAGIANAFGMKVSAWNTHVPAQVFENLNVTPGGRHERVDLEFRRGQRAYAVA